MNQTMCRNSKSKSNISFELKNIYLVELEKSLILQYYLVSVKYFFSSTEIFFKVGNNYKI